jgi:Na+-translocating ferredoxin:NAD+ oxidoreductase RnfD subunit
LVSGIFVFAVVFMASDPVTSPKSGWGQVFYGLIIGLGTMAVRYLATSEVSVVFPLLIANALVPSLDRAGARFAARFRATTVEESPNGEENRLEELTPEVAADE